MGIEVGYISCMTASSYEQQSLTVLLLSAHLHHILTLVDIRTHNTVFAFDARRGVRSFNFWHVANHHPQNA